MKEKPILPRELTFADKERNDRIYRAYNIAVKAHNGQTRKDGTTPYIKHPIRVAALVRSYGGTEPELIAALWHDVVEDCGTEWYVKMDECCFKNKYSPYTKWRIIEMVKSLTKNPSLKNREAKNEDALNRCMQLGTEFIKLCDRLDNVRDSNAMTTTFITKYLLETDELLAAFKVSGQPLDVELADDLYNTLTLEVKHIRQERDIV